jgi:hypothetical protein
MKKLNILISHSHSDARIAGQLKLCIETAFLGEPTVFLSAGLPPGANWLEELSEFLAKRPVTVVIASRTAMMRPWIWFEVGASWFASDSRNPGRGANERGRGLVIPLCCKGKTKSTLPEPLHFRTAVNLGRKGLKKLLGEIAAQSGCILDETIADTAIRRAFPNL